MTLPSQDISNRIALWGPHASGKTWYIQAFGKKLKEFSNDPDFSYDLFEGDEALYELLKENKSSPKIEIPINIGADDVKAVRPTEGQVDKIWVFRRQGKSPSLKHKVSSHAHKIHLVDNKGQDTIELKLNDVVINIVKSSDALVLMLDPTRVSTFTGPKLGNEEITYDPHQYTDLVSSLFQHLTASPKSKRYIAVCVSKIDQLAVKQRDPWELIQMYFGQQMCDLLKEFAKPSNIELETFAISAVGFYIENMELKANYHIATSSIAHPDNWKPYNVEAPLFWLFDKIERENLDDQNVSLLSKLLFQPERAKQYISYPIQRK